MTEPHPQDHDLIVSLDEKVEWLVKTVTEMKENTIRRVDSVEATRLDKEVFQTYRREHEGVHADEEGRLRRVEKVVWAVGGGLAIIQVVIGILVALKLK